MNWRIFAPPDFADIKQASTARQLYTITSLGIALTIAYSLVWSLAVPQHLWRLIMAVPLLLILGATMVLVRQRRISAGSLVFLGGIWAMVTLVSATAGGTRAPFFVLYTLLVLLAALFSGWHLAVGLTVLSLLAGLVMVHLDNLGMIPQPYATPISAWLTQATTMLFVTSIAHIVARDNQQTLKRIQRELVEREQIEAALRESEAQYRLVSSIASDYVFFVRFNEQGQRESRLLFGAFESISGYTPEEFKAMGGWRAILHPDDLAEDDRAFAALCQNQPVVSEVRTIRKDGEIRWVRVRAHPVWDAEQRRLLGINGAVRDVTERKQAEQALRESEAKFRTIFEMAPFAITIAKQDGSLLDVNSAFLDVVGLTRGEVVGKTPIDLGILNDPVVMIQMVEQLGQSRQINDLELRFIRHDGRAFDLLNSIRLFQLGAETCVLALTLDITARKHAEQALAKERKLLRAVIDHLPDNIFVKDREGKFILNNIESLRLIGVSRQEDALGKSDFDFFPSERAKRRFAEQQHVMESGEPVLEVEDFLPWNNETRRWIVSSIIPLRDDRGEVIGLVGINRNISQRKQMEESLRQSQHLLQRIIDTVPLDIFIYDLGLEQDTFHNRVHNLGYSPEDSANASESFYVGLIHPEDRLIYEDAFRRLLKAPDGEIVDSEYRMKHASGEYHWFFCRNTIFARLPDGSPRQYLGTNQDITERKRAEAALRESEEKFRAIFELAPYGITIQRLEGQIIDVNQAFLNAVGLSVEQVQGKTILELGNIGDPASLQPLMHELTHKERVVNREMTIYRPDGRHTLVLISSLQIRLGEEIRVLTMGVNITEQKRIEQQLQAERSLLRSLIDHLPDFVFVKDQESRFLVSNLAHTRLLGCQHEQELLGKTVAEFSLPELTNAYMLDDQIVFKSGETLLNKEEQIHTPNGERRWVITTKIPLRDHTGQIAGLIGISHDITERRQSEKALRESEERFRAIAEASPIAIMISQWTPEGHLLFANPSFFELYGYTPDELPHLTLQDLYHNLADRDLLLSELRQKGQLENYDVQGRRADGSSIWLSLTVVPIQYAGQSALITAVLNITERRRAELELQRSEEHYRKAITAAGLVPYVNDYRLRNFTFIGEDILKLTGYTAQEITPRLIKENILEERIWKTPPDLLPAEARQLVMSGVPLEWHSDYLMQTRTGEARWISDNSIPIVDQQGKSIGSIGILQDITERKQAEDAVRALNAALEQKAAQLATLNEIARDISALTDLNSTLHRVLDKLKVILPLDIFFVVLYDPSTQQVKFPIVYDGGQFWEHPPNTLSRYGLTSQVIHTGQPILKNLTEVEIESSAGSGSRLGDPSRKSASLLMVPLSLGGQILGVISVQSYTPNLYDERHMDLLIGAAYQVAVAVNNARLYDALRESEGTARAFQEKLRALHEINLALSTTHTLDELFRRAVLLGVQKLGFERLSLWLYDENDILHGTYSSDLGGGIHDERHIRSGLTDDVRGIHLVKEGIRARLWEDVDLKTKGSVVGRGWDVLAILWDGTRGIGLMSTDNYLTQQAPKPYTVDLLAQYGSLVGNLITRKRAEEEIHALNTDLLKQTEHLSVLNEIGRTISSLADLETVLRNIFSQLQTILHIDCFMVELFDFDRNTVGFPLVYDGGQFWDQPTEPLEWDRSGMTVQIIESRTSIILNRTEEQINARRSADDLIGDHSKVSASIVMVPLLLGNKLIGAISAHSYTPNTYNDEHVALLNRAAHQIAIAINNAQLYDALRKELEERKRAEDEVRSLNTELELRVEQRTTQLATVNKELEAFAYSVSHDLRAPLRSIDGFSRIVMESYSDKLDATGQNYLNRIRAATQRMGEMIDAVLTLSRVTRSELRVQSVDLSAMAQDIVDALMATDPTRQVKITIAPELRAEGDIRLLQMMLENLLGNAWKYTSKKSEAAIEFGSQVQDGLRVFFVKDNGAGFDMAYASKLFGSFQRLHNESEFPGTGVGLATVKRIIHRHNGYIWAEAEVDRGSTFYFVLGQSSDEGTA